MRYRSPFIATMGALALGACAPTVDEVRHQNFAGTAFEQRLAQNYRDLALYEHDAMYDEADAERFAQKARAANLGAGAPSPEDPTKWAIDRDKMPDLTSARSDLMAALAGDARTKLPGALARAQVQYDCWVEQEEEGHQPDHIAACRTGFQRAMAFVRGHEEAKPAAAADTTTRVIVAARAPEPAPSLPRLMPIHFGFDSAAFCRRSAEPSLR